MRDQLALLVEGAVVEFDDALARAATCSRASTGPRIRRARVSPWNSGLGKRTSSQPRLATVVPSVVSPTVMPTISPSVKALLTMRWPNSVSVRQYSSSRCSAAGLCVSAREEDVVGLGDGPPHDVAELLADLEFLEPQTGHQAPPLRLLWSCRG